MKNSSLFGLLLGLSAFIACAATPARMLANEPLSVEYRSDQPVRLLLQNIANRPVRAFVNLEVLETSGNWKTWSWRPEDGAMDAFSKNYPLAPNAKVAVTFDIRRIKFPPRPKVAANWPVAQRLTFRFRVVALDATRDDMLEERFTEAFEMLEPYKYAPK